MDVQNIKDVIDLSLKGAIKFPAVVSRLLADGIESYHVDFVRGENRYYAPNGESHVEAVPHDFPPAAQEFSADAVRASIQRVQAGEIDYVRFSEEVLQAGCVFYIAYLTGKRVVYFGREGDFHIERFPGT